MKAERGKVSIDEAKELIGAVGETRQGRETHNMKYAFWLGFLLGVSKNGGKHERLRAILKQKRFYD